MEEKWTRLKYGLIRAINFTNCFVEEEVVTSLTAEDTKRHISHLQSRFGQLEDAMDNNPSLEHDEELHSLCTNFVKAKNGIKNPTSGSRG